jgi:trans-2,3-dihydro-3-hydroxyanthranilate isomerase
MTFTFHTLDVFTNRRFCGNPLAVVLDADGLSTTQMQTIAREFNLSETIFVMAPTDPVNTARVRIFFPNGEIPFAGHPTVGCAILLATRPQRRAGEEVTIRLEEEAGLVPVTVTNLDAVPRAMFTAPVIPVEIANEATNAHDVAPAVGLAAEDLGFGDHRPRLHKAGPGCLHIPVRSREALARARPIEPHWSALFARLSTDQGYLYTPGGDHPGTAYRARMFAPTAMTPEDPATGSATAMLAAQLLTSEHLQDGTHRWSLEQGYEMGRPSDLHLEADVVAGQLTAVRVAGQAVHVMSGTLTI